MRTTHIVTLVARRLPATASVLALSTAAHAACTANQAPITATAGTGCITFNDGGAHTGAVTNPAGVTLAGTGAVAPTGTGISVRNATTLNGIITNNGTITSQSAFGIAAVGANTVIVGDIVNDGAIDNHNSTHSSIFVATGVSLQAGAGRQRLDHQYRLSHRQQRHHRQCGNWRFLERPRRQYHQHGKRNHQCADRHSVR